MNELAASSPVGANKLLFNPSLAGGSSQEPSPNIRGGLCRDRPPPHARGPCPRRAWKASRMNLGAVLEVLRRFVPLSNEMLMVGGGSKSRLWRQIFADVYRMDCVKTNVDQEAATLGAAAVAAVGAGLWKSFAKVDEAHTVESVQKPIPANVETYRKLAPAFEMHAQEPGCPWRPAAQANRGREGGNGMKIGLFTATFLDKKLEEVCTMAASLGYQAVELPAFAGNPHLDIEDVVKGSNAKTLLKM